MKKFRMIEESLYYRPEDLSMWESRNYNVINDNLPNHTKEFLIKKGDGRKGRRDRKRFFSELTILNHFSNFSTVAHYNSYKWLTKHLWSNGANARMDENQLIFYYDLNKYIGNRTVKYLQSRALRYRENDGGRKLGFTKGGKVRFPVAPDIWLVLKNGQMKFIEAKRNDDLIHTQLVGLAIIKKYLKCEVSIIRVIPYGDMSKNMRDYSDEFALIMERV
jgi:hypothetical protein